ncbi:MAG: OsmC family protein [Desulfovibrionaceae bacterium]|jgi:uncharacterized OsmC-like protein|nr:OsmC family protein [Desulfovibrionaceae bacterium]
MCATDAGPQYEVDVLATQGQGKRIEGRVRTHILHTDQPESLAGTDTAPNPPEMYAFSLGACLVSALRLVAQVEGMPIADIRVRVRGALGIGRLALEGKSRIGFPRFALDVRFDAPLSAEERQAFVDRVVGLCPVCANTMQPTPLQVVVH